MRRVAVAFGLIVAFAFAAPSADAGVVVQIDKSRQRMTVSVDGKVRHAWPVSTGRRGFGTPSGTFYPQRLARRWYSRKYYNSPMPYSIFFTKGYAIHGSYEIRRLGGPASHGCVRLHPANAATLFALVQQRGARIVISGAIRTASEPARRRAFWRYIPAPYDPPGYYDYASER
jgi:lipoprotein-anchoring transpeptidase ErfK/SrfK